MTEYTYNPADSPPGLVAVPCTDWLWTDSAVAFMNLMHALPPGTALSLGRNSASPAANRNSLTEAFLNNNALEWILYIDSDMIPPPVTAVRLLSHGLDIVGAQYFMRQPPFKPCWMHLSEEMRLRQDCTEPCEVAFVGTGCLLVRRNIIESMPFPWFEHPTPGYGEDRLFCEKARLQGAKIYVDCGLSIGHMTPRPVTREDALAFRMTPEGQAMYMRPSYPARQKEANDRAREEIFAR